MAMVSVVGLAGCPNKQARRKDSSGSPPPVTLCANLPPGRYVGVSDIDGTVKLSSETEYELTSLADTPSGKVATVTYYSNVDRDVDAAMGNNGRARHVDLVHRGTMRVDATTGLQRENHGTVTGEVKWAVLGHNGTSTLDFKMAYTAHPAWRPRARIRLRTVRGRLDRCPDWEDDG